MIKFAASGATAFTTLFRHLRQLWRWPPALIPEVADRIRRALEYVPAERLMINPDCGLRHLAPEVARQKLRAMVAGAALVRNELQGGKTA